MTASDPIDAARLNLLLNELRLPAIKHLWSAFTERADKEGWPAARLLWLDDEKRTIKRNRSVATAVILP